MAVSNVHARDLWESAKWHLRNSKSELGEKKKQALLRASLMQAMAFLESQTLLIGEHFKNTKVCTTHEKAVLLERSVNFRNGSFQLGKTSQFYQIDQKIMMIGKLFGGLTMANESWWPALKNAITARNEITHPKTDKQLTYLFVEKSLIAVIEATNCLYQAVFGKKLPYFTLGINPKDGW